MMINKKLFLLLLSFVTLISFTSCDDEEVTIYGNWVEKPQFGGDKRAQAVSFVIDNKLYFGLGFNDTRASRGQYFTDFYSYEGGTTWTPLAEFPGAKREGAFSFAVDGKGYIGGGYYGDTTEVYHSDVWEYDPASNAWTQLAEDFPGGKRTEAVSFVVGGKAYVAGGRFESDATKKDCYVFDSTTKKFTKAADMAFKRSGAFSFVIGDRAYVGGGYDNNFVKSFEYFNDKTKKWNDAGDLRDLYLPASITDGIDHYETELDIRRRWTSTFIIDDKGYIVGGNKNGVMNDCWEYDPSSDLWTRKSSFETDMLPRQKATSFVLNDVPYIMAGQSGLGYLDDLWSLEPNAEGDSND